METDYNVFPDMALHTDISYMPSNELSPAMPSIIDPAVDQPNVILYLLQQCSMDKLCKSLVKELMADAAALYKYSASALLPDAYMPISMDRSSAAFMQMPVFTKANPSMTKWHVLIDNLSNTFLYMVSIGMQLQTPLMYVIFLHDAKLVLMVQGNLELPAIAQAFLTHMVSSMLQVKKRIMVYVDIVYLKSLTGNEAEHVHDIGHFICCLSHPSLTKSNVDNLHRYWEELKQALLNVQ
ncbi:hypothetical protein LPJ66_001593 [Kickxella alabastrina]|uniref:Uncharacterized protein n=1 Tax=Kickxella alabastrina TaxID=61397 RepID=A0ACC1IST6_9FUNG|nr:hypothetical protein LPJ66_001593 [Kickxella alabastrina]